MKIFVFILISIFGFSHCFSQGNELSDDSYDSILINDISLLEIKKTKGDSLQLSNLIGNVIELKKKIYKYEGDNNLTYVFEGIQLLFSNLGGECQDYYCLVGFEASSITISNIKLKVGDSLSSHIGALKLNNRANGEKSIIFTRRNGYCCLIVIEYDNSSEIVKQIFYFEQT